jgi:hypothetical protein
MSAPTRCVGALKTPRADWFGIQAGFREHGGELIDITQIARPHPHHVENGIDVKGEGIGLPQLQADRAVEHHAGQVGAPRPQFARQALRQRAQCMPDAGEGWPWHQ